MINSLTALLPARLGRTQWVGLSLIALALLFSLLALSAFPADLTRANAWPFYLLSTIAFAAGCYVLSPKSKTAVAADPMTRPVVIAAGIILVIAIALRFYQLDTLPQGTWVDEADNGLRVNQILSDSNYRPVFVDQSNPPAHLFYLIALSYSLFGASTFSSRLVIAVFGVATVVMAFLAGREAHGNRFGLIFAFLVAVAHWALTFSRIALHGMTTPFFVLLTAYLLLRSKRTGRLLDFALAGLAVGFGLCFYTAYRTFLPVIAIFLVYWVFDVWRKRPAPDRREAVTGGALNLAAFGLAAGLAVAPVAQFALLFPSEFWARSEQVSVLNQTPGDKLIDTLATSTLKHVLMFNQRGDNNGRHNLPGEPMLDPVMGALFLVGLALALARPRDPARILFLLSIPFGLLGGILSLDFEAPQSLRSIAALPGVLYLAALTIETAWRGLEQSRVGRLIVWAAVALGAGFVLYYNAQLYFVRQAGNSGSWEAHNAVETLVARRMKTLAPQGYAFYASMYFNRHTVIRFLTPEVTESEWLIPPNIFPIREPGDKPVALFVDQLNPWITTEALRYYPNAQVTADYNPENVVVLYTVLIPAADIANVQGLTARYWLSSDTAGEPALERSEKTLDADWSASAPVSTPFTAEWSGVLFAPRFGDYQLRLQSPAGATVWLDEQAVLDGGSTQTITLQLAKGAHTLQVRAEGAAGQVKLEWAVPPPNPAEMPLEIPLVETNTELQTIAARWLYLSPPVTNNGLLGSYYPNADWAGAPAFQRIDPFINMYFHIIPIGQRPYTTDWTGRINLPRSGDWTFGLQVNGMAQLLIDGELVVDAPVPTGEIQNTINLAAGWHTIELKYLDNVGGSSIRLFWVPPGGEREYVPSSALSPY